MTVYILIPTFNEEDNIAELYKNLAGNCKTLNTHYLLVDDCSTDKTIELIHKNFKTGHYTIIEKTENLGPGDSFNRGFEWILNHSEDDRDIIVTMEADNTSDINLLSNMITISNLGYSLVLASVYTQGGGFQKTTFFRKVISFIANMFFRAFFDIKVLTLSSFYRVYHISLIREIKKKNNVIIEERGFISMVEILLKSIRSGAKIIEVPMILKSGQRKGKSKMKILKTANQYIKFFIKHFR